jgi:hypothetical protein
MTHVIMYVEYHTLHPRVALNPSVIRAVQDEHGLDGDHGEVLCHSGVPVMECHTTKLPKFCKESVPGFMHSLSHSICQLLITFQFLHLFYLLTSNRQMPF